MLFSPAKTIEIPGTAFTLVEPSTGAYRASTDIIRSLPKLDDDIVDVSLFQATIVLTCLHSDGIPVLITFMKDTGHQDIPSSITQCWETLGDKAQDLLKQFADACPISFMRDTFELIDTSVMPVTRKSQDKVKNA